MTLVFNRSLRLLALVIAALFGAGPLIADPGNKEAKHAEKAGKRAHKQAEKAGKHAQKRAEKSAKHAGKYAASADGHARGLDRERAHVRVGGYFNDHHRQVVRSYYSQHYGNGSSCPPGLAKKNNGCMPPGQAKKWAVGQPLPAGVAIYAVPQPVLVQLPPPPYGYRYARVGDDIVLVQAQNHIVIDIIYNLFG